jgi:hypothetical protein
MFNFFQKKFCVKDGKQKSKKLRDSSWCIATTVLALIELDDSLLKVIIAVLISDEDPILDINYFLNLRIKSILISFDSKPMYN